MVDDKLDNNTADFLFNDTDIEKLIEKIPKIGQPRLEKAVRNQVEVCMLSLDDKVPKGHPVREVLRFAEKIDLDIYHIEMKCIEGNAGRPGKDREIIFALWLYALTEGIASGRHIAKLLQRDDIYRWIAGGVNVNHHSLSDFRSKNKEKIDNLFIQCLAVIMKDLDIKVKRIGNDGVKIRAKAKRDKFKKEESIENHLIAAKEHLEAIDKQNEENIDLDKRTKAARKRRAQEKVDNCEKALETLKEIQKNKKPSEKDKIIVSITEPEARIMKFGGSSAFHPAYNVQCASDLDTNLIVGIIPTQDHNDSDGLSKVLPEVMKNLGYLPPELSTDKGYTNYNQMNYVAALGLDYYAPLLHDSNGSKKLSGFLKENSEFDIVNKEIKCPKDHIFNLGERNSSSCKGSIELRFARCGICKDCPFDSKCFPEKNGKKKREICITVPTPEYQNLLDKLDENMKKDYSEEILKLRFASELVHAKLQVNYSLTQFHVQTLVKVYSELLLVAIVHNFKRWVALKKSN